jgi:predicted dehydrogenase
MAAAGVVDAVDICTPSGLHAEQGLVAAEHGLHVLCEKPLDLRVDRAERLVEAAEGRGLVLSCVLQRRTYRATRAVTAACHEGRLGRLLSCSAHIKWWRDQAYYDSSAWRGTWALDGGVLANQAFHALDHLCWMAGPIVNVDYAVAETAVHSMEAEDLLIAVVQFESGARGVIEVTTGCNPPLCTRVEVFGTRGSAAFDDAEVVQFGCDGVDETDAFREGTGALGGRAEAMAISLAGHRAIVDDFVCAIREGRPPLVTGRDALVGVRALQAIYGAAGVGA